MTLRKGYESAQVRLVVAATALVLATVGCTTTPAGRDKNGALTYGTTPAAMVRDSQEVIREIFGPEVAPEAIDVAICESDLNPRAVSKGDDHGLFQINGVNRERFTEVTGQPWSAVYDPVWNTRYTFEAWKRSG